MENFVDKALEVVGSLEATPLDIPKELAWMEGDLRGAPVTMESKAWTHERYRLLRFTRLFSQDRIDTFNFVIYPQDHFDAPIFASDLVVTGNKLRVAVIDAMPLFPNEAIYEQEWVASFEDLYNKGITIAPQYDLKKDWSTQFLGEAATLATGLEKEEIYKIYDLWVEYLTRYLRLTSDLNKVNKEREEQIIAWHKAYNHTHLKVEDERNPYMVYFGNTLGKRYNREFLFSDRLGK